MNATSRQDVTKARRAGASPRQEGAAAVELALVLPVLVLMLMAIIEFGQAYNAKIELTAAVRDGARAAALSTDTASVTAAVTEAVRQATPGLDTEAIAVSVLTPCPATLSGPRNVTVVATYPFTYDVPFFRDGTWTITARGVVRCGG
jgi:Flp pilus assembly protein TadG